MRERTLATRTLLGMAALVWVALVLSNLAYAVDFDSSLYLSAAAWVAQGRVPYHDFFFFQPPGILDLYAPVVKAFGVGWTPVVMLSAAFGVGSLALLWSIAARVGGSTAALVAVGLGAFSYPAAAAFGHFYLIAPSVFFLLLAIWSDVCVTRRAAGIAVASAALMAATATRANYGLALAWYVVYLLTVEPRKLRALVACAGGALAAFAVLWGPALVADAPRTLFGISAEVTTMFPMWGVKWTLSGQLRGWLEDVARFPLVNLPLVAIAAVEWKRIARLASASLRGQCPDRFYWLVGGLWVTSALFSHLASPYYASHHYLFYIPLGLLLVARWAGPRVRSLWSHEPVVAALLGVWVLTAPLTSGGLLDDLRAWRDRAPGRLEVVVDAVKRHSAPGDRVLAFTPLISVLADRPLLAGLEASYVGFVPTWDRSRAEAQHLFNTEMLLSWTRCRTAPLVVVTDKDAVAFENTVLDQGRDVWTRFEQELSSAYTLAETVSIDRGYWGRARIYVRPAMGEAPPGCGR